MALNYFKQRDIDSMDANSVPDSFFRYFETLPEERKKEIVESRPDLAEPLGYVAKNKVVIQEKIEKNISNYRDVSIENTEIKKQTVEQNQRNNPKKKKKKQKDEFSEIKVNAYEKNDIEKILVDNIQPLEVLILPDNTENCPVHHCKFKEKQIRYKTKKGGTYGLVLKVCLDCKRVFLEESRAAYIEEELSRRNIIHTFYDKALSMRYLRSQQSVYQLGIEEKIYFPEAWIEEKPMCPLHDKILYEIPCEKKYGERKIEFTGWFCDECNKVLVRRARVADLIDQCAENGIPEIIFEELSAKKPKKKKLSIKEIKPDYFIQDGKRQKYDYSYNTDCFTLNEEDTVVVSDSMYCHLDGHNTEEVLALIMIQQKRGGRKAYLFMLGYCSECQKYYMDIDDYEAVYSVGRPEVTILSDLESDTYQITSGEIFNLEKAHLDDLEKNIDAEINCIKEQSDYVNPYAVGAYDDGNLSFAKAKSQRKYQSRLTELASYQPRPYNYRVDITSGKKTEIYYIGPMDVDLKDGRNVISFNSEFGHELVNYKTVKIEMDGINYDIKLSRQFDIDDGILFGYNNIRTYDDMIFRSGITDPFLMRVLRMRKKQHNLIDIIATIQENQNMIVDVQMSKNIIVQGCAGSGKTMVLLHRLSSLQYKNPSFDFGRNALILTPNDQFSLHIKGLAEGLQLGNIERESVEQYYVHVLMQYSKEFKPKMKLVSEMVVPNDYVNYIYSDQFLMDFDVAFKNIIEERNQVIDKLNKLSDMLEQPKRQINIEDNNRMIDQVKMWTKLSEDIVQTKDKTLEDAVNKLEELDGRKSFLEKKIPESEEFASNVVSKNSLPSVYSKIGVYLCEQDDLISKLRKELQLQEDEYQKVNSSFILFGKKARLDKINNDIVSLTVQIKEEEERKNKEMTILKASQADKSDEEILEWMGQVSQFISSVDEEIRLCKRSKDDLEKFKLEKLEISEKIQQEQEKIQKLKDNMYPMEVKELIVDIYKICEEYSLLGTYQKVFFQAVDSFKKQNSIGKIVGKYHRYDLYAMLLFAIKYYKSVPGEILYMCVDEGQDLAFNEYRMISKLNNDNVIFNIYGDINQLMKPGRGIADWTPIKEAFDAEEYILNENYRNTNQITRFCNASFEMNVLQTGVDGVKVREIARNELDEELAHLNITDERLAILVSRTIQKSKYLSDELLPKNIKAIIGDEIGNGKISLLYVDESKGIEFDKVYVVTANMEKNEKYIAYTRALSELIIVVEETML